MQRQRWLVASQLSSAPEDSYGDALHEIQSSIEKLMMIGYQEIVHENLQTINFKSGSPEPWVEVPMVKLEWDLAIESFAPFKVYQATYLVPELIINFQLENPDEPPVTVYDHIHRMWPLQPRYSARK